MVDTSELGKWLREQLKRRRMSQNAFIACAGISKGTVSAIINKGHIPKPEILEVIADFFNEPCGKIYRLAGLLPPDSELDPEEEEVLHLYRQLGPVERKRIRQAMRAWVEGEGETNSGEQGPSH